MKCADVMNPAGNCGALTDAAVSGDEHFAKDVVSVSPTLSPALGGSSRQKLVASCTETMIWAREAPARISTGRYKVGVIISEERSSVLLCNTIF